MCDEQDWVDRAVVRGILRLFQLTVYSVLGLAYLALAGSLVWSGWTLWRYWH